MRWPFRRTPSGKHALGAAVTAIPAGPVHHLPVEPPIPAAPVVRDVVAAPPVAVPAQPVVSEPAPRPAPVVPAPPAIPTQAPAPLAPAAPAAPSPLDPLLLAGELLSAPPVQAGPPDEVAPPALRRPPTPQAEAPVRPGTRVELGFADGTIRMLDPDSRTARALGELVGELTRPNGAAATPGEGSASR